MLRIHFTAEDLARVRISASWGPLAETLFSLYVLRDRVSSPLLGGWRQEVDHEMAHAARPLLRLAQPFAHVDLVTVAGEAESMDDALDSVLGAADAHLEDELEPLRARLVGASSWARRWIGALSDGDLDARKQLVSVLRDYSRLAIDPYWEGVRAHVEADRAVRARVMAEGGVEALLATLHPSVRWRPPVLEIHRTVDPSCRQPRPPLDMFLDGRSLVLVPSVFCQPVPMLFYSTINDAAAQILFYPALRDEEHALAIWAAEPARRPALEALLGRTRALALEAIAEVCTTTELARRIGVAPSTASHHASVLRDAGLIGTRRDGSAVLHHLTERGAALLFRT